MKLCQRYGDHKKTRSVENSKKNQHFNEIGWENTHIVLIENFPCNSKDELFARERHFIDLLNPELNTRLPCTTDDEKRENQKQWKSENSAKCQEFKNKYFEKNPEKKIERENTRNEKYNCPCGGTYTRKHISEHNNSLIHLKYKNL
jgi:hypothetical protein